MMLAAFFLFGACTGLVLVEWAEELEFRRRHRPPVQTPRRHRRHH